MTAKFGDVVDLLKKPTVSKNLKFSLLSRSSGDIAPVILTAFDVYGQNWRLHVHIFDQDLY